MMSSGANAPFPCHPPPRRLLQSVAVYQPFQPPPKIMVGTTPFSFGFAHPGTAYDIVQASAVGRMTGETKKKVPPRFPPRRGTSCSSRPSS